MRQDQRRPAGLLDDLGHGKRFAGAGDSEQHLMLLAVCDSANKLIDGRRLIAAWAIVDG
jgi:hypothetical protein